MSTKADIRRGVISDVLTTHCVDEDRFFSRSRDAELIAARKAAAIRLYAHGFSQAQIGRILNRNHTTIHHYLSDRFLLRKREYGRTKAALRTVTPKVLDAVQVLAAERGISAVKLAAEWIAERAAFETEQKRAAA